MYPGFISSKSFLDFLTSIKTTLSIEISNQKTSRQDGHVKVADLGLAKPDMYEGELAYSFCGSPEYMSPEMILQ